MGQGGRFSCSFVVDTDFALQMMSRKEFISYHHEDSSEECLENKVVFRMTDMEKRTHVNGVIIAPLVTKA